MSASASDEQEFLQSISVIRGNPSEDELAAVIAVLQEARKQQKRAVRTPQSTWSRNTTQLRDSVVIGSGQWGSSYKAGL
jgi:hypothetical protein